MTREYPPGQNPYLIFGTQFSFSSSQPVFFPSKWENDLSATFAAGV